MRQSQPKTAVKENPEEPGKEELPPKKEEPKADIEGVKMPEVNTINEFFGTKPNQEEVDEFADEEFDFKKPGEKRQSTTNKSSEKLPTLDEEDLSSNGSSSNSQDCSSSSSDSSSDNNDEMDLKKFEVCFPYRSKTIAESVST